METPPFIRWAITHRCPFRNRKSADAPEHAERLLRAAREIQAARASGRVVNKVVVEPSWNTKKLPQHVLGFAVEDGAAVYGGEKNLNTTCCACTAAVAGEVAGCVGVVMKSSLWDERSAWFKTWRQRRFAADGLSHLIHVLQSLITPGESETTGHKLPVFQFSDEIKPPQKQIARLMLACQLALKEQLVLQVQAFPAAQIEGRHWQIPPHCPQCGWSAAEPAIACPACEHKLKPAQRRLLRGTRPYRPIADFLSEGEVESLLKNP
jgi:hypothetical protein